MCTRFFGAVLGVMALSAYVADAQISLNISSVPGSTIQFNGTSSSFNFNPVGGNQWWITSVNNGAGDSLSLYGSFSGGPWTYGAITTSGQSQHAAVISPTGTFKILDGTGGSVVGSVGWVDVATYQYAGAINASAAINLTGLTYTPGATPISDLQALVVGGLGSALITFQFNPGMTLTDLTGGAGPYRTSYSGSLTAVPEAGTAVLTLLGLVPLAARRLRSKR